MKKILLMTMTVILLIVMIACRQEEQQSDDIDQITPDSTEEITETESTTDTTADTTENYYKTDAETYEISTPYGPIYYPTKWKDIVVTEVSETTEAYKIDFYAYLDLKYIPLYSVTFGSGTTNFVSGILPTSTGTVGVYFEDKTEGQSEQLTEESKDTYLMMCEDINVIISNLVYISGMELN